MPGKPATEEYTVLARKYRPKTFDEVIGQESIVRTLKNGIRQNRLAHAYLFSGPRGTGKTTLARLLAKAINCAAPGPDLEPCNQCASCKEITQGYSLDVVEIDGASNRGIDDIRQINETVGYSPASGKYKIYIIDEVHMLTKEAFNALLKTLEEPPANVKFFFATTEPHKVLPTILSRCQRLNLKSLSNQSIIDKLSLIAKDQKREVEEEVLSMVAERSEGGLRDAESLFDQMLAFYEGPLTALVAADALGTLPQEVFFKIDEAGKAGNLLFAFEVAHQIFQEGKEIGHFTKALIEHFKRHLIIQLSSTDSPLLELSRELKQKYANLTQIYRKEQLLSLIELCIETESTLQTSPCPKVALEGLLLKIFRSHTRIPIDSLVERLICLEKRIKEENANVTITPKPAEPVERKIEKAPAPKKESEQVKVEAKPPAPIEKMAPKTPASKRDTLLQFAAVELEGKIIKKS